MHCQKDSWRNFYNLNFWGKSGKTGRANNTANIFSLYILAAAVVTWLFKSFQGLLSHKLSVMHLVSFFFSLNGNESTWSCDSYVTTLLFIWLFSAFYYQSLFQYGGWCVLISLDSTWRLLLLAVVTHQMNTVELFAGTGIQGISLAFIELFFS